MGGEASLWPEGGHWCLILPGLHLVETDIPMVLLVALNLSASFHGRGACFCCGLSPLGSTWALARAPGAFPSCLAHLDLKEGLPLADVFLACGDSPSAKVSG